MDRTAPRKDRRLHPRLDAIDRAVARWMERWGHLLHRVSLGVFFVWMGALKLLGWKTGSSLLAHTVWWGDPGFVVPLLGGWEIAIGVALLFRPLVRVALLLLVLRMPGTVLALVLLPDVCFAAVPWAPTPEGQYLIKDLLLLSAAAVIGGTVRIEKAPHVLH